MHRTVTNLLVFVCLTLAVWIAMAQPTERVIESDLGWTTAGELEQGEWFQWEGDFFIKLKPEPNGLDFNWPDQSHKHLLYAAAEGRVLCARVNGVTGGPGHGGPERGGIVTFNAGAAVQRVSVRLEVIRTR